MQLISVQLVFPEGQVVILGYAVQVPAVAVVLQQIESPRHVLPVVSFVSVLKHVA